MPSENPWRGLPDPPEIPDPSLPAGGPARWHALNLLERAQVRLEEEMGLGVSVHSPRGTCPARVPEIDPDSPRAHPNFFEYTPDRHAILRF